MRGSLRLGARRGSRGKEGPDVLESCLWCVLDFFVGTCVIIPYPRRQSPYFLYHMIPILCSQSDSSLVI